MLTHNNHNLKPLHQLLGCLIANNRHNEVEQLVKNRITEDNDAELRYFLGLDYAVQGKEDEALSEIMHSLEKNPKNKSVRKLALKLLMHKVKARSKANDHVGLSTVLSKVMDIASDDADLHKELEMYKNILPMSLLKVGKREEAATIWKEELRRNPHNHRLIHNLALLYYWWALDFERNGNKDEGYVDPGGGQFIYKGGKLSKSEKRSNLDNKRTSKINFLWEQSIAYWVMLANNEAFWQEWRKEREKSCSLSVNEEDIGEIVRKHIDERFNKLFHSYLDKYKQSENADNSARHESYLSSLILETKTALHCREVITRLKDLGIPANGTIKRWELIRLIQEKEGNSPCFATVKKECKDNRDCYWFESCVENPSESNETVFLSNPCGPLMLREKNILREFYKLTEICCKNGYDSEKLLKLKIYLSQLGRALILIDEQKNPHNAITALEKLQEDIRDSAEANFLYALALSQRGKTYVHSGEIDKALSDLSEAKLKITNATRHSTDSFTKRLVIPLRDEIEKIAVDACVKEANSLKQKDRIAAAIKLLTEGLKIADQLSLKEHIAVLYCDLGAKKLDAKQFLDARKDFEKALSYDSSNRRAKEGIGTTYNNEGVSKNNPDESIPLLETAIKYDPDSNVIKENLAGAYNGKAISIVNSLTPNSSQDEYDKAINLLKKSVRILNPSLEESTINQIIEYDSEKEVDNITKDMADSLYKTVLKNLAAAANHRRYNVAGNYNKRAFDILNTLTQYSNYSKCDEAITFLKQALKILNPSFEMSLIESFANTEEWQFKNLTSNLSDGIYKTVLHNLWVACRTRRSLRGY